MLSAAEIQRLIKKELILADETILKVAEDWDLKGRRLSPRLIATVYSYMKHKHQDGATLMDMERTLGIACERISYAIRELSNHGYLVIGRSTKPFKYRVIR